MSSLRHKTCPVNHFRSRLDRPQEKAFIEQAIAQLLYSRLYQHQSQIVCKIGAQSFANQHQTSTQRCIRDTFLALCNYAQRQKCLKVADKICTNRQ